MNKTKTVDSGSKKAPTKRAGKSAAANPYMHILERQKAAFNTNDIRTYKERVDALMRLNKSLGEFSEELVSAIQADFGHRSHHETIITEVLASMAEIRITKAKLKGWMKHKKAPMSIAVMPATGRILYQPKGVVGIMGAWNYPAFLVFSPLIGVLSAGNHAMIKPSDVTPRTSEVIQKMIAKHFDEEYITVITGDVNAAIAFSELPFDHLIYTGNTEVGRKVMMAAAKNLTPVTLEMGGKSPTIISEDYPIKKVVTRIMMGKSINAGQTCVAPDYIMLPKSKEQDFINEYSKAAAKRYPSLANNEDITCIINDRHFKRIQGLIDDAKQKGANIIQVNPNNDSLPKGKCIIPTTIITNVTDDMKVMQEEIFGPVIPLKTYETLEEALQYVKNRERPLALYYFDNRKKRIDRMIKQSISGGACVNDTMLHLAHMNMPFGGVGSSGTGSYHGFDGFVEFSHKKAVLYQRKFFSPSVFMKGPYPQRLIGILKSLIKRLG
ncbi:MAG: coniferyl aldehyde dehydrogenase [Spirochaetota bacterium]|nr:coniferyl aldehyde dehydrogenase [Spirochaetota bacterium]